ncbi:hypothetical protein IJT10_07695 [bacterium]|nr:hypothetical protein [bacterium]
MTAFDDRVKNLEDLADNFENICTLVNSRELLEEALWFQAYEGFLFLKNAVGERTVNIRRYISEKVSGAETDGSLTDSVMNGLRRLYKKAGLDFPRNFKRRLYGNLERDTLIELAFVLTSDAKNRFEEFQHFIRDVACEQELSVAVPREFVLMYCLKKDKSWNEFNTLYADIAGKHRDAGVIYETDDEYFLNPSSRDENDKLYTGETTDREVKSVIDKLDRFANDKDLIDYVIKKSYPRAERKSVDGVQYSATAWWDVVRKFSILKSAEEECEFQRIDVNNYKGVFLSNILTEYNKLFNLCENYDFPKINENMSLSIEQYARFFCYRIRRPDKKNKNSHGLFCMEYGDLSSELSDNVFSYGQFYKLKKRLTEKGYRGHRELIDRYTILNVSFAYILLKHWKDDSDNIVEKDWDSINDLLSDCFVPFVNDRLGSTRYSEFRTSDHLYDALLYICMISLCPLEVYTRIFELNVISSYVNDPEDKKDCDTDTGMAIVEIDAKSSKAKVKKPKYRYYPPKERMQKILQKLVEIYTKLGDGQKFGLKDFKGSVKGLEEWQDKVK